MYLIEPYFRITALENHIVEQSRVLNALIDQWRYNGQIIGREISLYLVEDNGAQGFAMRVVCPEQDSLFPKIIMPKWILPCSRQKNLGFF